MNEYESLIMKIIFINFIIVVVVVVGLISIVIHFIFQYYKLYI